MRKTLVKLSLLSVLMLLLMGTQAMAQTKKVRKMQKSVEYPMYEKKWYKEEVAKLKEVLKDTRKSNREKRKTTRQANKLVRMRERISAKSDNSKNQ